MGEGKAPLASLEIFDPATGSLVVTAPLTLGRGGHAAAVTGDDRVVLVGGWIRPRTYTSTVEIFDPNSGTVIPGPELPYAADALAAVSLSDGRVLVTGGQVSPGAGTDLAVIFDPDSLTWTEVGPMLSARFKHEAVLLGDGKVLVIGGTEDDVELLASTEVFDPTTGRFEPGPDLVEPRYKLSGGVVVVDGTRAVIAGGGRTVELLDLATSRSTTLATLDGRGSFATINRLGSGDLLVVGGYDDQIKLRRETLLLDLDHP